jgi:group I intron endonuclease
VINDLPDLFMESSTDQENIFGIIYCATHKASGRRYIGQTYSKKKRSPETLLADRRIRHWREANRPILPTKKHHFQLALIKYGPDSFEWEILEATTSLEDLNTLESFYISKFQTSSDINGFNTRLEGTNTTYAGRAKRLMKRSAEKRWEGMLPEDRVALVNKQQKGRDKRPGLKEQQAEWFRRMHKDKVFVEKMTERRRQAMQSKSYREKRSKLTKSMWQKLSQEEREDRLRKFKFADNLGESWLKAIKSESYRKKHSKIGKSRYKRAFDVIDFETGEIICSFLNIVEAASFFVVPPANISATLHDKAVSFSNSHNPSFVGRKLVARFKDSTLKLRKRYDVNRKTIHIYRIDTGERIKSILGIGSATREIGTSPNACLRDNTLSFNGKGEWKQYGLLYATFEDKGNQLDKGFIQNIYKKKAPKPSSRRTPDEIILKIKALVESGISVTKATKTFEITRTAYYQNLKRIKE